MSKESAALPTGKKPKLQTYRVFVQQVNQTMVEVKARDADEAREKGYSLWRREYAHSRVCSVEAAS